MDFCALYHIVDSNYSYPISDDQLYVKLRVKKGDSIKGIFCCWNLVHLMYKEHFEQKMELICSDDLYSYYSTVLISKDPRFSYVFKIIDDKDDVYYFSEMGVKKDNYDFLNAYLDSFRCPYANPIDIVRENKAFSGRVFYEIFPDRFNIGNENKDKSYIDSDWYKTPVVRGNHYYGGDLKGIIQKLSYLKDLGIGAIWLTPIHPSQSYHKYDVKDYFDVDKQFGSKEDLKELIMDAHKLDIKIVLDMVFNHTSYLNPLFQDVVKNGKNSTYYDYFFIDGDKPDYNKRNYMTFADVPSMPKLNSNNEKVMEYCAKVMCYYAKDFNVDGFRLDVANEVSHAFWRYVKAQLVKINPDIMLIGESWYNSHEYLSNSEWESVMNYNLMNISKDFYCFHTISAEVFAEKINFLNQRYRDQNNRMLLNLLDSHDTRRFFDILKPNKDAFIMAYATLIMHIGLPLVYYGDEIFMDGENDPFCRKPMNWKSEEFNGKYFQLFKEVIHLRQYDVISHGEMKVYSKDDLLFIERFNETEKIVLVINNSTIHKHLIKSNIILSNNYDSGNLGNNSFIIYRDKGEKL